MGGAIDIGSNTNNVHTPIGGSTVEITYREKSGFNWINEIVLHVAKIVTYCSNSNARCRQLTVSMVGPHNTSSCDPVTA